MSAFDLLDDEDLIYQQQQQQSRNNKKNKQKTNKQKQASSQLKAVVVETEFTKIHLSEVWMVILKFLDFKTLYTKLIFVDRKVCEILYTVEFQKFILENEFKQVLAGEYEVDHAALYSKNMALQRSIERVLEVNDPLNIFELRVRRSTKQRQCDHSHKVFANTYFGLLNRRTNYFNRNMKLRPLVRTRVYIGARMETDFDTYKRKNMKLLTSADENGLGWMDNETIPDIQQEQRKQLECEHFTIEVVKNPREQDYPFSLICKSCQATGLPYRETVMKKVEKYL